MIFLAVNRISQISKPSVNEYCRFKHSGRERSVFKKRKWGGAYYNIHDLCCSLGIALMNETFSRDTSIRLALIHSDWPGQSDSGSSYSASDERDITDHTSASGLAAEGLQFSVWFYLDCRFWCASLPNWDVIYQIKFCSSPVWTPYWTVSPRTNFSQIPTCWIWRTWTSPTFSLMW